jgi:hypothetical protein
MSKAYYGIYRGTVAKNVDPMGLGRVAALVPEVGGEVPLGWAMPCVPPAAKPAGTFMVPAIGAGVWLQFEAGDLDRPVWTGGWWGEVAEGPPVAVSGPAGDPGIVLSAAGATIAINETGIAIDNGKGARLTMIGPAVTINEGALVVV